MDESTAYIEWTQPLPEGRTGQSWSMIPKMSHHAGGSKNSRNRPEIVIDTIAGPGENLSIPPIKPILAAAICKHPQVRVVARDEDTEFVECQQCGEVFDAVEYRDMMLEEEESRKATDETA